MRKRRYSMGGGVPTTGGAYDASPVQYPFPTPGGGNPLPSSTNTTVNVNGEQVDAKQKEGPLEGIGNYADEEPTSMRRGGKVKTKRVRGDGIAKRGRTRGRFV